jgi:hypothetical protein
MEGKLPFIFKISRNEPLEAGPRDSKTPVQLANGAVYTGEWDDAGKVR